MLFFSRFPRNLTGLALSGALVLSVPAASAEPGKVCTADQIYNLSYHPVSCGEKNVPRTVEFDQKNNSVTITCSNGPVKAPIPGTPTCYILDRHLVGIYYPSGK